MNKRSDGICFDYDVWIWDFGKHPQCFNKKDGIWTFGARLPVVGKSNAPKQSQRLLGNYPIRSREIRTCSLLIYLYAHYCGGWRAGCRDGCIPGGPAVPVWGRVWPERSPRQRGTGRSHRTLGRRRTTAIGPPSLKETNREFTDSCVDQSHAPSHPSIKLDWLHKLTLTVPWLPV